MKGLPAATAFAKPPIAAGEAGRHDDQAHAWRTCSTSMPRRRVQLVAACFGDTSVRFTGEVRRPLSPRQDCASSNIIIIAPTEPQALHRLRGSGFSLHQGHAAPPCRGVLRKRIPMVPMPVSGRSICRSINPGAFARPLLRSRPVRTTCSPQRLALRGLAVTSSQCRRRLGDSGVYERQPKFEAEVSLRCQQARLRRIESEASDLSRIAFYVIESGDTPGDGARGYRVWAG